MLGLIPRQGFVGSWRSNTSTFPQYNLWSYKLRNAHFRENSISTSHAKRHQNQRRSVKHPKRPLMHFDILLETTDHISYLRMKTLSQNLKTTISSSGSSPHPNKLLAKTTKLVAFLSLTLPPPPPHINFNGPLTSEEKNVYDKLPPCVTQYQITSFTAMETA